MLAYSMKNEIAVNEIETETNIEYKIGDRVKILPRRDTKYLYWHGHIGTIEEIGPYFDNGVARTICMKFDIPSSGMSRMIVQPNEIEYITKEEV